MSSKNSAIIKAEGVSKKFTLGERDSYMTLTDLLARTINPKRLLKKEKAEQFWALQDINFEVKKGEVIGLIGRNGAGKSTLLKILSQINAPSTGQIVLNGRVASLLEVGTGFHPELTGRENIFLNGVILGMTRQEIARKFDEIVAFAEIEQFLDTPVKRYSSGMYVRLAFAVAAHLEPEILLVDEVLAVGDAEFQKKCLGKMNQVTREEGRTIIFVSHNLGAVQKLCQRGILLKKGKIIADGPINQTIRTYLKEISSSGAQIDLAKRRDRQGNGRLKVTKIGFQDGTGKATDVFQTGQGFQVVFEYDTSGGSGSLRDATISMAISNQMGELILNLVNTATGDQFANIPPRGKFILRLDQLPLVPGTYYFNSFITINKEIADWVIDAGSFEVEFGDFYGTGELPPEGQGNFLLKHTWKVAPR